MSFKMKIEDQVCSLELPKKLKELGVNQYSLFYWFRLDDNYFIDYHENSDVHLSYPDPEKICSAFTVAELGDMLPRKIDDHYLKISFRDIYYEYKNNWIVEYEKNYFTIKDYYFGSPNLADAIAKMLIYLIENNLVKVEDINARMD